ncbi:carbohydrate ABC transporter membrane protein 2 (CUT1 family) [Lachnotalea glycerini]|uniref:Carbohydrate ABC transporter membrane protein 2 (CUT1 family) n=1 Tax=Lachnotalea glycerini TaxID=1763509 RepID=A0A255IAN1_9FIRM|nr:carbohydrate ABC transporter permease [Lachnotalea glycerini]PXV89137.1 carbohydrate ABC transporter membrane protein 2 (CUT1 family) [Lachnotalea glycerini]RDY28865.1 carbohydrate ABC transporter permease [Lachnotalea glycerini]
MKQMVKAKRMKLNSSDVIFNILNYGFFMIFTLICIYPFYYLLINTISSNQLSANGVINLIPKEIHIQNYINVIKIRGLGTALMISIARTLLGTTFTVLASSFLGFMFTQQKMWGRKFWYRFIVVTMYFNAGLIPMFLTMKNLHLTNTFWVYIIPAVVQPFNIILVKTYVESIPSSLQEAAEIDGAGIITVFLRIILPTCKPILATIAIFSAVNQWNNFYDTLIYITDQKLYSLQYLLYCYINQANSLKALINNATGGGGAADMMALATQQTPTSIRMTVTVIVVIPILCIYPIFQRYFVKGIMIGSVKG